MSRFLWICFAGALGTGTRYVVGLGAARLFGPAFPYGTLTVNLVGCFLISAIADVAFTTKLVDVAGVSVPVGAEAVPNPAGVALLKGQHRWHALIKAATRGAAQSLLDRLDAVGGLPRSKGVHIVIDVDPYVTS